MAHTQKEHIAFTLRSDQYLSDLTLPLTSQYTMINAPTGCGKTEWAVRTFHNCDMLFPTRINGQQKSEKYGIHFVMEHVQPNDDPQQFGTFDAITKLTRHRDCSQKTLVVDESHHHILSSGETFRRTTITALLDAFDRYKRVVFLTGTPIETTHPLFQKFTTITITRENAQHPEYTLIHANHVLPTIIELLRRKKTNFIFCNDKQRIQRYSAFFEQKGLKTGIITSDTIGDSLAQHLIQQSTVPDIYDVILVTSVIGESIDILNTNIGSIHFLTRDTPALIAQFISRFRNIVPRQVYIYVSGEQDSTIRFDVALEESVLRSRAARKLDLYNTILSDDMISKEGLVNAVRHELRSDFTHMYRIVNGQYCVDETGIAYLVYQKYVKAMYLNTNLLITELNKYGIHCAAYADASGTFVSEDQKLYDTLREHITTQKKHIFTTHIKIIQDAGERGLQGLTAHIPIARHIQTLMTHHGLSFQHAITLFTAYGNTTQGYNRLIRRLHIRQYRTAEAKDAEGTIDRITRAFTIGKKYTREDIYRIFDRIYQQSDFYTQPMTQTKAVQLLKDFFDTKRCKVKRNGIITNGYTISSDDPLRHDIP